MAKRSKRLPVRRWQSQASDLPRPAGENGKEDLAVHTAEDASALFARAMEGVQPLRNRDLVRAPRKRSVPRRTGPPARSKAGFEVEAYGERVAGRAADADHALLSRLQRGEMAVEVEVDLHGMDAGQAREAVRGVVARAQRAGQRCLLVIHGRGLRSPAGPVLKQALPGWLTEPPLDRQVLAFTSAGAGHGDTGATLVLLRRGDRAPRRRR